MYKFAIVLLSLTACASSFEGQKMTKYRTTNGVVMHCFENYLPSFTVDTAARVVAEVMQGFELYSYNDSLRALNDLPVYCDTVRLQENTLAWGVYNSHLKSIWLYVSEYETACQTLQVLAHEFIHAVAHAKEPDNFRAQVEHRMPWFDRRGRPERSVSAVVKHEIKRRCSR